METSLKRDTRRSFLLKCAGAVMAAPGLAASSGNGPLVVRTPGNGLQPQTVVDANGLIHMVYLAGDPAAADVFYAQKTTGDGAFSTPLRVNDQLGAAIALGTVRGARIAIGREGRIHVAWNGSSKANPKGPRDSTPMLYARMNEAGNGFEPARNLMRQSSGLDGGGTIADDGRGNVYIAWHGQSALARPQENEGSRRVWLAVSKDDGQSFAPETAVSPAETGACGCCGIGVALR
jgi:hypothetical protein